MMKRNGWSVLAVGAVLAAFSTRASAQAIPWVEYLDDGSGEVCGVINTANAEFVVLAGTGELVIVSGPDFTLVDSFVDESGNVFLGGFPVGVLEYANDQFGFPKLFWFDLDGFLVGLDVVTGEPVATTTLPNEIDGICAACELWDDLADCDGGIVDSDLDGVDDEFDFCDNTPLDEIAEVDGCSCGQLDSDQDEVSDCEDECPDTIPGDVVNFSGCGCLELDDDEDGISDCVDECLFTPLDEPADDFGCSCSQLDSDTDGIFDCFDECPNTPDGVDVDFNGCSDGDIIVVDPIDIPIVISCGNFSALTMMGLFAGLCSMRMGRRGRPVE